MLKIFIGYDPREAIAYHVLAHSIIRHASRPVSITPLMLHQLENDDLYWRPRHPKQSTDFTFSRFLTPFLANSGYSLFMDCDMLCRGDVHELVDVATLHPANDVYVVQHDPYESKVQRKFLHQPQTDYPFKNWSSVMLFNGYRTATQCLTPELINRLTPMELHQFHWATKIGTLPPEWNHLVGEHAPMPNAKLVHFTLGGPYFTDYAHCEFADEWFAEYELMLTCETASTVLRSPDL